MWEEIYLDCQIEAKLECKTLLFRLMEGLLLMFSTANRKHVIEPCHILPDVEAEVLCG